MHPSYFDNAAIRDAWKRAAIDNRGSGISVRERFIRDGLIVPAKTA